jgi:DNA-binding transcriptional ArsR family regulator
MPVIQARPAAVAAPTVKLALLLGVGRARILIALYRPQTTIELALSLGLAASTVSAHLTALTEAGLLSRKRAGRSVFYQLNPRGQTLIDLMSAED